MSQPKCGKREAEQDEVVEIDNLWVKEKQDEVVEIDRLWVKEKQDEVAEIDRLWVNRVLGDIEMSQQRIRLTRPTIFKVPSILRSSDPDAYKPKLVSIGPYHHGDDSLQPMEEIKRQILGNLLSKAPENSIYRYLKEMQELEAKARSYFSEIINMESRRFAEMLLLDGCFIIQLFILDEYECKALSDLLNDQSFLVEVYLFTDLLRLENQLPYFIINELLGVLDIPGLKDFRIQKTILEKLRQKYSQFQSSSTEAAKDSEVAHLLHLLHGSITRSSGPQFPPNQRKPRKPKADGERLVWTSPLPRRAQVLRSAGLKILISIPRCPLSLQCLKRSRSRSRGSLDPQARSRWRGSLDPQAFVDVPSATELVEAGVKIKVSKAANFLDISFNKKKGLLEIPVIVVYNFTGLILRNLIALEQFCMDVGKKITYYSVFMDCIINTERDVALLSQEGIIVRGAGNDTDIALLFNKLSKGVLIDEKDNYFSQFKEVNDYCNSRWNKWRARLMRDYFSNPWAIISVIAAAVLLVLTIVQTLFSVLGYTQQINSSDRPHP